MALDFCVKYGPVVCGLHAFLALLCSNLFRIKEGHLKALFVVVAAGSSIPIGVLLIISTFDETIISNLNDAGVYMAFAGRTHAVLAAQLWQRCTCFSLFEGHHNLAVDITWFFYVEPPVSIVRENSTFTPMKNIL